MDVAQLTVATASLPTRCAMLASDRFVTMVPTRIALLPRKSAALRTLPIDLPTSLRPAAAITLKKRPLSPVAKLFVNCARERRKVVSKEEMTGACVRRWPIPDRSLGAPASPLHASR